MLRWQPVEEGSWINVSSQILEEAEDTTYAESEVCLLAKACIGVLTAHCAL